MAKQTLGFRVDPELVDDLDEIARVTGESRSEVAERALKLGVAEIRNMGKLAQSPVIGAVIRALIDSDQFGEIADAGDARERARRWMEEGKRKRAGDRGPEARPA